MLAEGAGRNDGDAWTDGAVTFGGDDRNAGVDEDEKLGIGDATVLGARGAARNSGSGPAPELGAE
jgi:hypothetical protein